MYIHIIKTNNKEEATDPKNKYNTSRTSSMHDPDKFDTLKINIKRMLSSNKRVSNEYTDMSQFEHIKLDYRFKSRKELSCFVIEGFLYFFTYITDFKIDEIEMNDNIIEPILFSGFRKLFSEAQHLRILNLSNCMINFDNAVFIGECLSVLKNKESVEAIDLSKNRIITIPDELIEGLSGLNNLQDLRLNSNIIRDESLELLISKLIGKPIKILDLRYNRVNIGACKSLGKLFALGFVKELCLSNCSISSEGFKVFLTEALKKSDSYDICKAKKYKFDKTILDISSNAIGNDCIPLLKEFCKIYYIGELYIYGNKIDFCDELKEIIEKKGGFFYNDKKGITFTRFEESFGINKKGIKNVYEL